MSPFAAGLRLNDRFVLVALLGSGGMSQVWRATDDLLGRPVAVKTLAGEIAADPALREATWREARAAARLTHPGVARVYDYGEAPLPGGGHAPYVVMELVEGESMASRLAAGPLPWPQVARIGTHIAAALAAAHEFGVVHQDVKPANVMLTGDGAKVLDFGTAALVGAIDHDVLAGTPSYIAPERLDWSPAQPASDIYSLGVLLYEALTGRPPAALSNWDEAAVAHRHGVGVSAETIPGLPPPAAELIDACRSPDPVRRPRAREVASALAGMAGLPDPVASLPSEPATIVTPVVTVPGGTGGATVPGVGSATPPALPTMVEDRVGGWEARDRRAVSSARGGSRLLLAGVATVAVLLGLAIGLAFARSPVDQPDQAGPAAGSDAAGSTTPAETAPAGPSAGPPADDFSTAGVRAVLNDVDQAIREARNSGTLARDTAADLRDQLRDITRELNEPQRAADERAERAREEIDELREEIEEMREEGEIPGPLADDLRQRLATLNS